MNIDGNLHALRLYEKRQDELQRYDDWMDEVVSEIWDTPAWLEQVIADAPDDCDLGDAVDDAAREYILEQQRIKHECSAD